MHLFSDAVTYSTRYLNGSFLLRHVVNLRECQVHMHTYIRMYTYIRIYTCIYIQDPS